MNPTANPTTANPGDYEDRARRAEQGIAQILMRHAGLLLDVQNDVQPDGRREIAALTRNSSAMRVAIEVPRRGVAVPATITVSILDADGGEREVRVLRLAPDSSAH